MGNVPNTPASTLMALPPELLALVNSVNTTLPASLQTSCEDYIQDRGDLVRTFAPAAGNVSDMISADTNVRYTDGVVGVRTTDLASDALGFGWGMTRDWTNMANQPDNLTGNGFVETDLPHARQITGPPNGPTISVISNGFNARYYDDNGLGGYTDRFFLQETLSHDTTNKAFVLTDTLGDQLRFNDFSVTPTAKQGTFKSYADPYGNLTSVVSYTSAGLPQEVQRSSTVGGTTVVESYLYTYNASNQISSAVERRGSSTTGPWTTVRQTAYTYYTNSSNYGLAGDLQLAQTEDPSSNILDTTYYRYYTTNSSTGYTNALKYVFRPASYARLTAALGGGVDSLTDTQVAPYADQYFEYNSSKQVTKVTLAGAGSTVGSGNGQGTYTYTYTTSSFGNGYNIWQTKTVETLPDGNQNIVYTNHYGETMLHVYKDVASGNQWADFTEFDSSGRAILNAGPSAVTGYDDTKQDLLNNQSGNYQYLSDTTGLVTVYDYTTSAPVGDMLDVKIQQGELGTAIKQEQWAYVSRAASVGTIYKLSSDTVYRNTDGTGGETTSFTYTWVGTTAGVQSIQTSLPVISSAQNGPGAADVETVFLDGWGRPNWLKDADGFIFYAAYDQASGSAVKEIDDVDTTKTGDFANLPSGWTTPTGGGLHLLSTAVVDALGRTTQYTDPKGNVTYLVYKDTNYEVRVYPGWQSGSLTTTGPTTDYREDRPGSYLEVLTMSATPHTTGGVPDGTEQIGYIQTLSRDITNNAGQFTFSDEYFNLSGIAYSTAVTLGVLGTNYNRTTEDYDSRGRAYRTLMPTGTYYKTLYDGQDRPISDWIGTDDGSPGNMTQIAGYVYDTFTPPAAPTLSQVSGGTLAATTYYAKVAYVFNGPVQPASAESILAVAANKLLQVTSPASTAGATGYNVYAATATGKELLQNTSPIAIGTAWTEPTTGLTTTGEAPFTNAVGDSNLSQTTEYPGGSAANRVTNDYYDWRDRLVAEKNGVQASESTTVHRPIVYTTYDNLDEATQVQAYDGDGVTITPSAGVPQTPSASLLRAQSNIAYDDQGRVYQTQTFSVDPSTGSVSTNSLNSYLWYNHRGDVIEERHPGGLSTKYAYDGTERVTVAYATDANGDAAPGAANNWANAGTVSTNNNVLEQSESTYDKNDNLIFAVDRQRNHDETTGGPLGNETTTPKSRVYYTADYYDALDRLTTTVDVGTNAGTAYTRPATPDARSDTVLRSDYNYAGDNVQAVSLTGGPTGGTFTLTWNGQTTAAIAWNASAATVQSALQALSNIGTGNALVASPTGTGWVVRFAGTLANAVQPTMSGSGAGLTGGTNPGVSITVTSLGGDDGQLQQTTDPRGLVGKIDYDYLRRTVRTVDGFSTFNPSGGSDQTTEYSYDGDSNLLTLQADLANSTYEQTKWVYGVTTTGGSGLNSKDIVSAVQHPDKVSGNPSSGEQDSQTVDALGETLTATDRNGNVHTLTYDVLGRLTSDAVTTLGSGVDGSVRRIDTAYDTQGNPYLLTSYADTGGATIVNQVQRSFNGLGQLTQEWQAHSGAVNTSTTPSVQYAYTVMSGGQNNSRLTSMTYPNGKVLTYNYNSGVDSTISRLSSLSDNSGTLESYSYLGLGTVVKRAHPQPNVDLTYIGTGTGDAGDQYTGLDRFGRVVEQKWYNNTTASTTDDFKYGYDRNSNVLYRTNEINHSFDELYHANGSTNGYDNLNQLTSFARGTLNANHDTISSPTHSINYTLDAQGNFASTQTDGGSSVSNTFNKQNEETAAGTSTLTFDSNGNLTTDDLGHTLVYDAWNRLVTVKNGASTLTSYQYDAVGRRIVENPGTVHDLYYNAGWQLLEERWAGVSTATIQYVWSPVYIDAMVLRDRSTQNNGTLDERLWVQQDANYNVTALYNGSGAVVERYVYDPYGKQTVLDASFNTRTSSSYAFVHGWQGLRLDTASGDYDARDRAVSPSLGRPVQSDPLSFGSGDTNFYRLDGNSPSNAVDPSGLAAADLNGNILVTHAINPPTESKPGGWEQLFYLTAPGQMMVGMDLANALGHRLHLDGTGGVASAVGDLGQGFGSGIKQGLEGVGKGFVDNIAKKVVGISDMVQDPSGFIKGQYRQFLQDPTGLKRRIGGLIEWGKEFDEHPSETCGSLATDAAITAGIVKLGELISGEPKSCFPAGTPVQTLAGLKPIEQVGVGDQVWSYDHRHLRWAERPVIEVYQLQHRGPMATLQVKGEIIRATGGHPFWVVRGEGLGERPLPVRIAAYEAAGRQQGRWVLARDLRAGDEVLLRQGEVVALDSVQVEEVIEDVYNFHVAELQNYTVGNWGILVHNTNDPAGSSPRKPSRQIRKEWEEAHPGENWPKDPNTGWNQDVAHKKPLADGGTNELDNIEPLPHDQHVQQHIDNGDFKRWGGRKGNTR